MCVLEPSCEQNSQKVYSNATQEGCVGFHNIPAYDGKYAMTLNLLMCML